MVLRVGFISVEHFWQKFVLYLNQMPSIIESFAEQQQQQHKFCQHFSYIILPIFHLAQIHL